MGNSAASGCNIIATAMSADGAAFPMRVPRDDGAGAQ
jgi:hypothetical protein